MDERVYGDAEVAEIFRDAATRLPGTPRLSAAPQDGLTLAQIQSIGREVGLAPDAIAQAAAAVEMRRTSPWRRWLGLPVGVVRVVDLGRRIGDDEWDQLVVRLRSVFGATGRVQVDGGLRQWSNGNLHVRLEPTAAGHRLHLSTTNGPSLSYLRGGAAAAGFGAILFLVGAVAHAPDMFTPALFATIGGVGSMVMGALRLPRWAPLRARQMEEIAAECQTSRGLP